VNTATAGFVTILGKMTEISLRKNSFAV